MSTVSYQLPKTEPDRVGPGFAAIDFSLDTDKLNVADITLTAPYPAHYMATNHVSDMAVYILEGRVVHIHRNAQGGIERVQLTMGALISIPKGIDYRWSPDGEVRMLVFSTPPWTPEQHNTHR